MGIKNNAQTICRIETIFSERSFQHYRISPIQAQFEYFLKAF